MVSVNTQQPQGRRGLRRIPFFPVLLALAASLVGCASLEEALRPVPPQVELEQLELTALSFDGLELTARVSVTNPNPVGVRLAGFAWELALADVPFLSGDQQEGVEIAPRGTRTVTIPVSLTFREALEVIQSLEGAREIPYAMEIRPRVEVPIIGPVEVSVSGSGTVPVPRVPRLDLRMVRLDRISLSGADLTLSLGVINPNTFGFTLDRLTYSFRVNGQDWLAGRSTAARQLGPDGETTLDLAVSLNFRELGRGLYRLLTGGGDLNYQLSAQALVTPELPLLETREFPLQRSGSISLTR